jgi:hypothetical protein
MLMDKKHKLSVWCRDIPVVSPRRHVLHFSNRQHALDDPSKDDVLAIEELGRRAGDEELAAVGSWTGVGLGWGSVDDEPGQRHRQ